MEIGTPSSSQGILPRFFVGRRAPVELVKANLAEMLFRAAGVPVAAE
jgi:hypothetical protein